MVRNLLFLYKFLFSLCYDRHYVVNSENIIKILMQYLFKETIPTCFFVTFYFIF